jgi:radical SAM protein with 4Fe4S-binding SPASM domain
MRQAKAMGFRGQVCLSYYNEPLCDERIRKFAKFAKRAGFRKVKIWTNGDKLKEKAARRLDGIVDQIRVSLYDDRTKTNMKSLQRLFRETQLYFTPGRHCRIHYAKITKQELRRGIDEPCGGVGKNMIVAYNGDVLACCEEIVPHFELGNVHDKSLQDIWKKQLRLAQRLRQPGGRRQYPYCMACPRSRQERLRARFRVVSA